MRAEADSEEEIELESIERESYTQLPGKSRGLVEHAVSSCWAQEVSEVTFEEDVAETRAIFADDGSDGTSSEGHVCMARNAIFLPNVFDSKPLTPEEVRVEEEQRERLRLSFLRNLKETPPSEGEDLQGIGLAMSGGGVRAASLALGMCWRLAEENLLMEVSYMSAVSGGGYALSSIITHLLAECEQWDTSSFQDAANRQRRAVAQAIRMFQRHASFALYPLAVITRLRGRVSRCIVGSLCLAVSAVYILICDPIFIFVLVFVPSIFIYSSVFGAVLRYSYCRPPFWCEDDTCSKYGLRGTWMHRLVVDPFFNFLWIILGLVVGLVVLLGLLRCCGITRRLQDDEMFSSFIPKRVRMLPADLLFGLEGCMKRVFVILLVVGCLAGYVLFIQVLDYGTVDEVWQQVHDKNLNVVDVLATQPVGWWLPFDLDQSEFPGRLENNNTITSDYPVRFETWYSCYNYSMREWVAKPEWVVHQGPDIGCTSHHGAQLPLFRNSLNCQDRHGEECMDRVVDARSFETSWDTRSFSPWWDGWAFGAFYWGHFNSTAPLYRGKVGCAELHTNYSVLSPHRRHMYQRWKDSCQAKHQVMCFMPGRFTIGETAVAGCCHHRGLLLISFLAGLIVLAGITVLLMCNRGYFIMQCLKLILPLLFWFATAALLRWRIFGPVTAAPSNSEEGQQLVPAFHFLPFTFVNWNYFFYTVLILAILALPCLEMMQRMLHLYYKHTLSNSFLHEDYRSIPLTDTAKVPICPVLIYGLTSLMYRCEYEQKEHFHNCSLSSCHMGSPVMGYYHTPEHIKMTQAMACSGAAPDTMLLTTKDSPMVRMWMMALNIMTGDWTKFQPDSSLNTRGLHALPIMLFFMLGILLIGLAQIFEYRCNCTLFYVCLIMVIVGLLSIFLGIFFTPLCSLSLRCLQGSPVVRMWQMAMVAAPLTRKGEPPPYMYLGDGGLTENSGCLELLRRRLRRIVVMDSEADTEFKFYDLHTLLKFMSEEGLCSFFNYDDPTIGLEEVCRRWRDNDQQTFLHLGVAYYAVDAAGNRVTEQTGEVFWVQLRQPRGWEQWQAISEFLPSSKGGVGAGCCWEDQSDDDSSSTPELQHMSHSSTGKVESPVEDLQGCCLDECDCCIHCGAYPYVSTNHQIYSPKLAANMINLGYHLSKDAIEALKSSLKHRRAGE